MDEYVKRTMTNCSEVPAVYGWLSLDQRGRWCLEGRPITHRPSIDFISRNYAQDERGCWYFQNGPQRVFVTLDYTPWVLRLNAPEALRTHTGLDVRSLEATFMDEEGNLLMLTEHGIGLLCDQDLAPVAEYLVGRYGQAMDVDELASAVLACQAGDVSALGLRWHGEILRLSCIERDSVAKRFEFNPVPSDTTR